METERLVAWRLRAKGKGLRWQILRDIIVTLSISALRTEDIQNVMNVHKGLTHLKVNQMLDELKQSNCVVQDFDKDRGYFWAVTQTGISFYVGSRQDIPNSVREVLYKAIIGVTTKKLDDFEGEV